MGIIAKLGSFFRSNPVDSGNLTETSDFWYSSFVNSIASSGVAVNTNNAMGLWAVYACVSEISQTLAQLPLKLKRPKQGGGTEDAVDHPLYNLCKTLPNPQMTSFSWRESQQANLLNTGNNYNLIQRRRGGETAAIWPIDPTTVTCRTASNREAAGLRLSKAERIVYDVKLNDGKNKVYAARDILHIVGFGSNGLIGESVITKYAKETIGIGLTLDDFQGKAMKNGFYPSGVLQHPGKLGNKEAFISALRARYSGTANAKNPLILEEGMEWQEADVSMVDKQFIEQTKMTANQVCGIYKVPPHRIGIYEKNTNYNNTEQENRAFLYLTMNQWVVRWEQSLNWKLLTEDERSKGYFFKFNFDALLRPDAKTRSELEWREWQMGTPLNDIRKRNDQNPLDGGDVAYVPVNMVPHELSGKQLKDNIAADESAKTEAEQKSIDGILRYYNNRVTRIYEKHRKHKLDDLETSLQKAETETIQKIETDVKPLVIAIRGSDINGVIDKVIDDIKNRRTEAHKSVDDE